MEELKKLKFIKISILLSFSLFILIMPHALFSPDTNAQYNQALLNIYDDWHPPIMAYVWRKTIQIIGHKEGIYYIHFIFFVLGVFLISKYIEKKSYLISIIFIVISFLSANLGSMIFYIWKDTGMLASYILSIGIILNLKKDRKMNVIYLMLVFSLLFYGTALRSNSIFAVLPLIGLLLYKILKNKVKVIILTFTFWIGVLILINYINYDVLNSKKLYPIKYIYISDIINISFRKKIEIPNFLKNENFSQELFEDKFIGQPNINQYVFVKTPIINMITDLRDNDIKNFNNYKEIKNYWSNLILSNKLIYLKMKIKYFLRLILIPFIFIIYNFLFQLWLIFNKKIEIEIFLIYLSSLFYLGPYIIFNASYDLRYIVYCIIIEIFLSIYNTWNYYDFIIEKIKKIKVKDLELTELISDYK